MLERQKDEKIIIDGVEFSEIKNRKNTVYSFKAKEGNSWYFWEKGVLRYSDSKKSLYYDESGEHDFALGIDDIVLFSLKVKLRKLKELAEQIVKNGQA